MISQCLVAHPARHRTTVLVLHEEANAILFQVLVLEARKRHKILEELVATLPVLFRLERRPRLNKDERKIVHRHLHGLAQFKPVGCGLADEVVYVSHAPARVSPL
jgi:hypothetical protein